jgi:hypothetical protein
LKLLSRSRLAKTLDALRAWPELLVRKKPFA